MPTQTARSAIRIGLAALGFLVAIPMFGACAVQPASEGGEDVGSTNEALTCGAGTSYGYATCDAMAPAAACYGDPTLRLMAGEDAMQLVANDEAPLLLESGSCTYSTPESDDVSAFIAAMRQYTGLSPQPINVSHATGSGSHVYLGYDVSALTGGALTNVESLVNQWACNSLVAPGLYRQQPDFNDCAYSKSHPYLPSQVVLFDPSACPKGGCSRGGI